jgi:iron complex outermembrane receptor protein
MPAILFIVLLSAFAVSTPLAAQETTTRGAADTVVVTVVVRHDTLLLEDVLVRSGQVGRSTDAQGVTALRLPPGRHEITATRIGFRPESLVVTLRSGGDTTLMIALTSQAVALSGVVVSATRSGRRIEDEPLRVETLAQEEVEEKTLMTPGDITMMLNETSGMRVQAASPSLGGAAVRIQGLRGRYTQILSDGLPLYGGQTGGAGLLQIPPMDLGGVEIIKGVSSALYGGSALGGVINLISRRPADQRATELLLNQTTLGGTDAVGFLSGRLSDEWGYTVLLGGHRQTMNDIDDDAWADLPAYNRGVLRTRAFWSNERGHSFMYTLGATMEDRDGGTMTGGHPILGVHPEGLRTNRYDGGLVGGYLLGKGVILATRTAITHQRHLHTFDYLKQERDEHLTWLGETALTIPHGISLWVIGAAIQGERYRSEDVPRFDFSFRTPGAFLQNTLTISTALSVTASARVDRHSEYGTQVAPRVSALLRLTPLWNLRVSGGGGYFAPTPFVEETEVVGLERVEDWQGIRAERARSGSVDLGGTIADVEINATLFGSVVEHPLGARESFAGDDRVLLRNIAGPTRTAGGELLLRWSANEFHYTGSYTFVRSTEQDPQTGARRDVPLTPSHQAGIVTMWEREGLARAGVEVYYTGVQSLDDNPFRDESKPWVHVGVLAERRFGDARVFINAENLLGFRQTRYDPLVSDRTGLGQRRTVDVWGPLEGRVANLGVRFSWE